MSQILNSLVISDDMKVQRALEEVMSDKIEGYIPSFVSYPLDRLDEVDRSPDLIFLQNNPGITPDIAHEIAVRFPGRTYVILDPNPEAVRREFIKAGFDEALSIEALQSDLGRHLLEKLLALKDLAAAEARAELSEERFRDIIEHSHDMISLLDQDGTLLYTSPAFGRQMRYEPWEVLGQVFFDFVHEDDAKAMRESFTKILQSKSNEGISLEFQFRRNDGEWRNIEVIASNLLENATVQAVVLNARDVTEQKKTENELLQYRKHLEDLVTQRTREAKEANRRADTFLAASPDTLIAIDAEGRISFASQHYKQRFTKESAVFSPGNHILDAYEVMAKNIPLSRDDPRYEEMKNWWKNPEGTHEFRLAGGMWVRVQASRIEETGETVVSTTDITDYKRQQAMLAAQAVELSSALEKERQVVEQQKTFVSMVSHEFRTPLTIIDGNAQILFNRGASMEEDKLRHRAGTIRSAVDRLVRLIETVLSAHMMESGKLIVDPKPINLEHLIRQIVEDQQDVSSYHKFHMRFNDVPAKLMVDEKIIRHALTNLLSNAVKYSPASPDIDVVTTKEGDDIVIRVKDKGLGIPENEMPRIFAKYFRASTSGGIPGSGLGLSLVKQFIELHNGSISLQSQVGQGTEVILRLPIVLEN